MSALKGFSSLREAKDYLQAVYGMEFWSIAEYARAIGRGRTTALKMAARSPSMLRVLYRGGHAFFVPAGTPPICNEPGSVYMRRSRKYQSMASRTKLRPWEKESIWADWPTERAKYKTTYNNYKSSARVVGRNQ